MNIDQIRAFCKVATTGSFTKAARELCLTQSTVSQQIRSLEERIGGTLFDRSGRKILLTGKGEVLLNYAERLFALHEEIETLFGGLQTLQKGKAAVAVSGLMGTYFMPVIIWNYRRQYPGIEIDLRMGNSDYVQRMVLDREVDLGIGGMIRDHAGLQAIHLHREKLLIVCSPRDPMAARNRITLKDLRQTPFIWREKGTQTRALVKAWFRENAADDFHPPAIALQNLEAAKRMVEQGYGVTIIPETAFRREIDAGLLKSLQVEEFDLSVDYHLFYFKGKVLSRAAEAFLETICNLRVFSHGENLRGKPWKNPESICPHPPNHPQNLKRGKLTRPSRDSFRTKA